MGCDIHFYIEYKWTSPKMSFWKSFGFCKITLSRNYQMFGELCSGVREYNSCNFEKGLPNDIGSMAEQDNIYYPEGSEKRIPNPDWHHHSWLTSKEFESAIKRYESKYGLDVIQEYKACLALMNSLEQSGYEARCVFWFDN